MIRYIPRFNAITEITILKTSDSERAFSIRDSVVIINRNFIYLIPIVNIFTIMS